MSMPRGVQTKKRKMIREERRNIQINHTNTENMKQWMRSGQTSADYVNHAVAFQNTRNLEDKHIEVYERLGESGLFYENQELKKDIEHHMIFRKEVRDLADYCKNRMNQIKKK